MMSAIKVLYPPLICIEIEGDGRGRVVGEEEGEKRRRRDRHGGYPRIIYPRERSERQKGRSTKILSPRDHRGWGAASGVNDRDHLLAILSIQRTYTVLPRWIVYVYFSNRKTREFCGKLDRIKRIEKYVIRERFSLIEIYTNFPRLWRRKNSIIGSAVYLSSSLSSTAGIIASSRKTVK